MRHRFQQAKELAVQLQEVKAELEASQQAAGARSQEVVVLQAALRLHAVELAGQGFADAHARLLATVAQARSKTLEPRISMGIISLS